MITLKTDNWEIDNIDAVIFDKDGTIQDVHEYWGRIIEIRSKELRSLFKLNQPYHQKLCQWMGYSIKDKKLLKEGPVGLVSREEVIKILAGHLNKEGIVVNEESLAKIFIRIHNEFLKKMKKYVKILPGIKDFIKELKDKKVKIAIITSDSISNAEESIKLLGLDGYFDLLMGKEHSTAPKVSGIPAKTAIQLLKVVKEKTVCFGDAPMDLIMAKRSGLKAGIGIAYGQTSYEDLLTYSPYALHNYHEVNVV